MSGTLIDRPVTPSTGVRDAVAVPVIGPRAVPEALRRTDIFDPARTGRSGQTGAALATGPLGDAWLAGSVQIGRRAYVVLQRGGGGGALRLAVGESYHGLRLIAISTAGATFRQGSGQVQVPYGAISIQPGPEADSGSEEGN